MKDEMAQTLNDSDEQFLPYTIELNEGIKNIKLGKTSGLAGITAEMVRHFGQKNLRVAPPTIQHLYHSTQGTQNLEEGQSRGSPKTRQRSEVPKELYTNFSTMHPL